MDVFLGPYFAGAGPRSQVELVPEPLGRANTYLKAGADCVYPIGLWEMDALRRFISEVSGPMDVIRLPRRRRSPSWLGLARVSWATVLHREAMARFEDQLGSLQE